MKYNRFFLSTIIMVFVLDCLDLLLRTNKFRIDIFCYLTGHFEVILKFSWLIIIDVIK
jgi:hypothetical protein